MKHRKEIDLPDNKIFVGILKEEESYEIRIISSFSALRQEGRTLVYWRSFSEVLLALGYRDILQKLSVSSVKNIIRKANPEEANLL